jgi:hypothetical protein
MSVICASLAEELQLDFLQASEQLARARLRRAEKDTSANRVAVAECRAHIDAVLDMYLQCRSPTG